MATLLLAYQQRLLQLLSNGLAVLLIFWLGSQLAYTLLLQAAAKLLRRREVDNTVGVQLRSLFAFPGTAGLAVAFKGTLADFAAWLLAIFHPSRVDETIAGAGVIGAAVEQIRLFSTLLKFMNNKILTILNGTIVSSTLTSCLRQLQRWIDGLVEVACNIQNTSTAANHQFSFFDDKKKFPLEEKLAAKENASKTIIQNIKTTADNQYFNKDNKNFLIKNGSVIVNNQNYPADKKNLSLVKKLVEKEKEVIEKEREIVKKEREAVENEKEVVKKEREVVEEVEEVVEKEREVAEKEVTEKGRENAAKIIIQNTKTKKGSATQAIIQNTSTLGKHQLPSGNSKKSPSSKKRERHPSHNSSALANHQFPFPFFEDKKNLRLAEKLVAKEKFTQSIIQNTSTAANNQPTTSTFAILHNRFRRLFLACASSYSVVNAPLDTSTKR